MSLVNVNVSLPPTSTFTSYLVDSRPVRRERNILLESRTGSSDLSRKRDVLSESLHSGDSVVGSRSYVHKVDGSVYDVVEDGGSECLVFTKHSVRKPMFVQCPSQSFVVINLMESFPLITPESTKPLLVSLATLVNLLCDNRDIFPVII